MKRTLTLLTVLVVLLAGCTGATTNATPTAGSGGSADTNSVTSSGTASVSASPDTAVISVAVEATADNASAARSQVATDAESLRSALTEAGYDVRTTDYRLSPMYDHSRDQRELVGYRAVHAFEFEAEPDAAGDAVDLAVDNGATAVNDVRFELSDDHRAELRDQALEMAMGDARGDAQTVATAADRSLGTELSIQVSPENGYSPYRVETAAAGGDASTSFEPGPVTVTASVTVTYELE